MTKLFEPKELEGKRIDSLLEEPKTEIFEGEDIADSEKFFAMYENLTVNHIEWLRKKKLVPVYIDFDIAHKKNRIGSRDFFLSIAFNYKNNGDFESSDVYLSEGFRKPLWFRREKTHFNLMETYCSYITDKQIEPVFLKKSEEMNFYGHYKPKDRNILIQKNMANTLEFVASIYANIVYNSKKHLKYNITNSELCFLKEDLEFFEKGEYEQYSFLPKEVAYERSLEDAKNFNLMKIVREKFKKK